MGVDQVVFPLETNQSPRDQLIAFFNTVVKRQEVGPNLQKSLEIRPINNEKYIYIYI